MKAPEGTRGLDPDHEFHESAARSVVARARKPLGWRCDVHTVAFLEASQPHACARGPGRHGRGRFGAPPRRQCRAPGRHGHDLERRPAPAPSRPPQGGREDPRPRCPRRPQPHRARSRDPGGPRPVRGPRRDRGQRDEGRVRPRAVRAPELRIGRARHRDGRGPPAGPSGPHARASGRRADPDPFGGTRRFDRAEQVDAQAAAARRDRDRASGIRRRPPGRAPPGRSARCALRLRAGARRNLRGLSRAGHRARSRSR